MASWAEVRIVSRTNVERARAETTSAKVRLLSFNKTVSGDPKKVKIPIAVTKTVITEMQKFVSSRSTVDVPIRRAHEITAATTDIKTAYSPPKYKRDKRMIVFERSRFRLDFGNWIRNSVETPTATAPIITA
jgi:hypothetical protein